jgi:hypothetical protein
MLQDLQSLAALLTHLQNDALIKQSVGQSFLKVVSITSFSGSIFYTFCNDFLPEIDFKFTLLPHRK